MEHPSDPFYDHASSTTRFDCDAHVNDRPKPGWDVCLRSSRTARPRWSTAKRATTGLQRRRERAPGRLTAPAGLSYLEVRARGRELRDDATGKLRHQSTPRRHDIDGMYLQVLYPSVTLLGAKIYAPSPSYRSRAYARTTTGWRNSARLDGRLIGQGILPTTASTTPSRDETLPRPGPSRRGDLGVPNGSLDPRRRDEPLGVRARVTRRSRCTSEASCRRRDLTHRSFDERAAVMGAAGATKSGSHTAAGGLSTALLRRLRAVHRLSCCSSSPTSGGSRHCWNRSTTCSTGTVLTKAKACARPRAGSSTATSGPRSCIALWAWISATA